MPFDDSTDYVHLVFLTMSSIGQLNVHQATIEYLLTRPSDGRRLHLHLVSFDPAEKRAKALAAVAQNTQHRFTFHTLGEFPVFGEVFKGAVVRHGPATLLGGGLKTYDLFASLIAFSPKHYIPVYQRITQLLKDIKPKVHTVAMDSVILPVGIDACKAAGVTYGVLCPNNSLDLCVYFQPWLGMFWKYPAPYSNITFPVPLHLIPYNTALMVALIRIFWRTNKRLREVEEVRRQAGIVEPLLPMKRDVMPFVICATVPELEYPHKSQDNMVLTGPIILPVAPVTAERYPDLVKFMDRKRTFVMNMGTEFRYNAQDVTAICGAILDAKRRCKNKPFQVLWKLNGKKEFVSQLEQILGAEIDDVRTEEWIEPSALAVLQHPNVACFINHGGANSVLEAGQAGIPQIILPQWLDLYDYANRVEWLGHGIYANKGHPAEIEQQQLADAFVRILSDDEGAALKAKSLEIAEACRRGGGVKRAAETVLASGYNNL